MKVTQAGKRRAHNKGALMRIRITALINSALLAAVGKTAERLAEGLRAMFAPWIEITQHIAAEAAALKEAIEKQKGSA